MVSTLLQPYNYETSPNGYYTFITDAQFEYKAYFTLDSSWFPDSPEVGNICYSFGFHRATIKDEPGKRVQKLADPRIQLTIINLISGHFERIPESIVIYYCENEDGKHCGRKAIFGEWATSSDAQVTKLDKLVYYEKSEICASVLLMSNHKLIDQVTAIFLSGNIDVTNKMRY